MWFCTLEVRWRFHGLPPAVAHPRSVWRWVRRLVPYHMAGNGEKTELVGADIILLGVIQIVYPQVLQDEMALYIYSEGGGMYLNSLISLRLGELQVTYKKVSVEAYDAFSPRNLLREELFWTKGLPLGKVGIERRKLIDVDEFGVEYKRLNRSKGWGVY